MSLLVHQHSSFIAQNTCIHSNTATSLRLRKAIIISKVGIFLRLATLLVGHNMIHMNLIVNFCHDFHATNMDTPLFICTKEEQQAVICFLWVEGVRSAKQFTGLTSTDIRKEADIRPLPLLKKTLSP